MSTVTYDPTVLYECLMCPEKFAHAEPIQTHLLDTGHPWRAIRVTAKEAITRNPHSRCSVHAREGYFSPDCMWCTVVVNGHRIDVAEGYPYSNGIPAW